MIELLELCKCRWCNKSFPREELYKRFAGYDSFGNRRFTYRCVSCHIKAGKRRFEGREERKAKERENEQQRVALLIESHKEYFEKCKIGGTCQIIHAHHDILANDPEHLTSEFIIGMTCGPSGVHEYQIKRGKASP